MNVRQSLTSTRSAVGLAGVGLAGLLAACTGAAPSTPAGQSPVPAKAGSPRAASPVAQASPGVRVTAPSPAAALAPSPSPVGRVASPSPVASPALAPKEALTRGFTIMENVRSFRFDGQIDTAGTPVDIQGEVIRGSAARVTSGANEFIIANETLYVRQSGGTWFGVRVADAGERMPPIFDPQEQLRALVQGRDFRLVGTDVVRGTPTAVYSFTSTEGGRQQEIKVWISRDERPRKLEISEGGQVLTTLFFGDFNEVSDIEAPEGAEIVDADRLVEALPSPAPRRLGR